MKTVHHPLLVIGEAADERAWRLVFVMYDYEAYQGDMIAGLKKITEDPTITLDKFDREVISEIMGLSTSVFEMYLHTALLVTSDLNRRYGVIPDINNYALPQEQRIHNIITGGYWAGFIKVKDTVIDIDEKYGTPNFASIWDEEERYEILAEGGVDAAKKEDISNLPEFPVFFHALLDEGDDWYSRDTIGEEETCQRIRETIERVPGDTLMTVIDYECLSD